MSGCKIAMSLPSPRRSRPSAADGERCHAQVTVGFAPSVRAQGVTQQAELIRQLAAALDKVQHLDLKGICFMLGHEYGVDAKGQLWLDVQDNALVWSG
jgi:hypothetical protein